ncbi:hypothetical protein [Limnospira fusiformis]|uniref:hypothetical protein n=1 Tax=Limnospira fusiformis TaxID=54297 RepID=UPI001449CF7E|nr:hypothetical protein HFV01_22185 [Limnospira fusiformis SAG 85.79]
MGGGTEPNNNISQLCWVSPNLPSSNLSKVSRAIAFRVEAYLVRLGGGTEPNNNISQLCWVSPNLPSSNLSKVSRAIAFRRRAYLVGWVEVRNPTTTSLSYVGFHPTYPARIYRK